MTSPYQRCIMILADGAREDVFRELLAKGELPNIQKELVEKGTFATGVTAFPSTTGPAYFPFLTGCFPGTLNVPGIRWFDKSAYADPAKKLIKFRSYVGLETFLINRDVDPAYPTLFQLLSKSYNIFNSVCRGVGKRNLTKIMRIWYWYYAHLTDRWDFVDQVALEKTRATLASDFDFIFVVFPGIDEYSHLAHPHHEKTIGQYHFLDKGIGEIVADLKRLGKWEGTLLWIVSDHGLSRTHTHFCVNTFLAKRGLPAFYYPKVFHRRGKKTANMMSGNGMTHLYFKNGGDWKKPTTRAQIMAIHQTLLAELLAEEAIDILCVRNESGGVDVLSKRGEATIQWLEETMTYTVRTTDPFGYPALPQTLTKREAFEKTWATEYPDALWQIADIFQASRTGDVVLSAKSGFDLRLEYEIPEHKGSHGSLHREHMLVPIVTNAQLPVTHLRTADCFPTTLRLLKKVRQFTIDGDNVFRLQA